MDYIRGVAGACSSSTKPSFPDLPGNFDAPSATRIANVAGCAGAAQARGYGDQRASCNLGPVSRGTGITVLTSNSQRSPRGTDSIENDLRFEQRSMAQQGITTVFMVGHHLLLEYWYQGARPDTVHPVAARVGAQVVAG